MLIPKRFSGWVLWPFVFVRHPKLKQDVIFLNHERIHLRQQLELLVVPFFLWYGIEFVIRLLHFGTTREAYRNISFEREAYKNENDLNYLKQRRAYAFSKYI